MERLEDGTLRITHESGEGGDYSFETDAGFANEGDLIRVSYSWDAEKGGGIVIDNFTQDTGDYGNTPAGLTMDQSSSRKGSRQAPSRFSILTAVHVTALRMAA